MISSKFRFLLASLCLALSATNFITAQHCFDADFESGTLGGYTSFYGWIDDDGEVIFPIEGLSVDQHQIMEVSDGYDPIANQYCIENKELLTTGSSTGKYTLRLGDANTGARAAKIVLSFDVTENVSFFLLKYAVVLNDPGHDHEVQPSFALNIKDEDGNILDCGTYEVRAAENIDGFEACGDWRVRPWTTAGFELASYQGQKINIEISTTDCGLGGHAGYAYIDATCNPLKLDLQSYCPGQGYAKYVVTEGFDSYLWNTGETSRFLHIDDPMPGQEYQVTVTSSTGCTLVLKDTLPATPTMDFLEPSFFDGVDTISVCYGESIEYAPTGSNVDVVESLELGYSSDVFYIFAEESRVINFVTQDNLGCTYDTTQLVLNVEYLDVGLDVIPTCDGYADGVLIIDNYGNDNVLTSLGNLPFQNVYQYGGLAPGNYVLNLSSENGCQVSKNFIVLGREIPELGDIDISPATCDVENAIVSINSNNADLQYSLDGEDFQNQPTWTNLPGGSHTIAYRIGNDGCVLDQSFMIETYSPPEIKILTQDSTYCGFDNGSIIVQAEGGLPPLQFSKGDNAFIDSPSFFNLAESAYSLIVRDSANCRDTISTAIFGSPFNLIGDVDTTPASCAEHNGTLSLTVMDDNIPFSMFVNSVETQEVSYENLEGGHYNLVLVDHNACRDSMVAFVKTILPPVLDSVSYMDLPCGDEAVQIEMHSTSHNDSIQYNWNNGRYKSDSIYTLLPYNYELSMIDETGCVVDTLLEVLPDNRFGLPNIFSPDDDGVNDEFCYQVQTGVESIDELIIYDRWGNNVFDLPRTTYVPDQVCWDGTFRNGPVENGVYVYYIKIRLLDGRYLCRYGDVTVLK